MLPRLRCVLLAAGAGLAAPAALQAQDAGGPVAALVARLEAAVQQGDSALLGPLVAPAADSEQIAEFAARWLDDRTTRAVVRERDRVPLEDGGLHLVLEGFVEQGARARVTTWQAVVAPAPDEWRIVRIETVGAVDGLHRLSLDTDRQFRASHFRLGAEDFELRLPSGTVFLVEVQEGVTGLVLMGRGTMRFTPAPETEQGQLRIFAGSPTLDAAFDAAFVRFPASAFDLDDHAGSLTAFPPQPRAVRAALELFRRHVPKSFSVDLGDLSPELWSLVPTTGDFLAEVETRRHGTLTYARATNEPEDITLFDRAKRRNISLYQSRARLASSGRAFNEDDQADYDVLDYSIDASFSPDRLWVEGRARLRLRVRAHAIGSLSLRLASTLAVRAVSSEAHGRLLYLRVRNQDSVVVNLPGAFTRDTDLTLHVAYGGRLEPQTLDREAVEAGQLEMQRGDEVPVVQPEPSVVYSNRSYWYPQSPVSDYATATLRITVPASSAAVCSGNPAEGSPVHAGADGRAPRRIYVFAASQPVRYLGCVIARLIHEDTREVTLSADASAPSGGTADAARHERLAISLHASPRLRARGREVAERTADAAAYYGSLIGEFPYPSFAVAVVESYVPGGHSPAYFAVYHQPLPTSPFSWRDDPASFDNYPEFFLAHELAHQWWGQGVGWQNYHDQWLSEGFAQYFAALYANHRRGPQVFDGILRQLHRWAVRSSDQGPVWLGYRLGHIRGDPRVTRALVYNKGAMVLHMLRRLMGDDPFFAALRRFYRAHRFTKAGTDDFRRAVEAESGRSFERFFEDWIYGSRLPSVRWSWKPAPDGTAIDVRIEQTGPLFEFPLTVTVQQADGARHEVVVPVSEQEAHRRIPVTGPVRRVEVNGDRAALLGDARG